MNEKQKWSTKNIAGVKVLRLITLLLLVHALACCGGQGSAPQSQQGSRSKRDAKIAVGERMDIGQLELLSGERRPVVAPGKRATLLTFWASWCGLCRAEMPALVRLHQSQKDTGIEVVGVNVGEKTGRIKAFLQDHSLPYPIALDREEAAMHDLGFEGLPAMVLVDREGVARFVGNRLPDESALLAQLPADQ